MIPEAITGRVDGTGHPMIRVRMLTADRSRSVAAEVMLDTGFSGGLALPRTTLVDAGFEFLGYHSMRLGDGQQKHFEAGLGIVDWDGEERSVLVIATDGVPVAGMEFLRNARVTIEAWFGGRVTLTSNANFANIRLP